MQQAWGPWLEPCTRGMHAQSLQKSCPACCPGPPQCFGCSCTAGSCPSLTHSFPTGVQACLPRHRLDAINFAPAAGTSCCCPDTMNWPPAAATSCCHPCAFDSCSLLLLAALPHGYTSTCLLLVAAHAKLLLPTHTTMPSDRLSQSYPPSHY